MRILSISLEEGPGENQMTSYVQTLIIPMPRQKLSDAKTGSKDWSNRNRCRNACNDDVNTIMAFFD